MKTVKRQHYVLQFYLKHFTIDRKRLFVFDKIKNEIRGPENIVNVAQERYFYDLPLESIPNKPNVNQDPQLEEKVLGALENEFNKAVEAALRVARGGGATLAERKQMATFVTFQWLRTKTFRIRLANDSIKTFEAINDTLLRLIMPEAALQLKTIAHHDDDSATVLHFNTMWDLEIIEQIIAGLYNHLWFLGVNETETPLYTSDNPVVLKANKSKDLPSISTNGLPGITLAAIELESELPSPIEEGVEVIFPITPRLALFMVERTFFSELEDKQGKVFTMSKSHVEFINRLQVVQSDRQIFCNKNDFDLARDVCEKDPEALSPYKDKLKASVKVYETVDRDTFLKTKIERL